ncbi:MAG: DUF6986 family protein, partial [Gemmatimonadaceae bacterium]
MSIHPAELAEVSAALWEANLAFARRHPGDRGGTPQPVHTFIEGAQHFTANVAAKRGAQALETLDTYAPDAATLGTALGMSSHPALGLVA